MPNTYGHNIRHYALIMYLTQVTDLSADWWRWTVIFRWVKAETSRCHIKKKVGDITVVPTYKRNSSFLGIKAAGICNTNQQIPVTLKETHVCET